MSCCYCKKRNPKKILQACSKITCNTTKADRSFPQTEGEENQPVQLNCFLIAWIALKKKKKKGQEESRLAEQTTKGKSNKSGRVTEIYYSQSSPNTCHVHTLYLQPGRPPKKRWINRTADLGGSLWSNCLTCAQNYCTLWDLLSIKHTFPPALEVFQRNHSVTPPQ